MAANVTTTCNILIKFIIVSICTFSFFFFNNTATTDIYTLSLHDALPIYIALRDRARLDGQERRSRQPVQDEHSPHLRRDGDRRRPVFPGEQRRLRRYVIIPDVVMHHLKSPHEFTSARAQGRHRIRPLVVALSEATEIIRARAPRWNENHVAFGIHRNRSEERRVGKECRSRWWV